MNKEQHPNREDLIDFQHRELDAGRDAEILGHLESCRDCASVHDEEARVGEWLRSHAKSEVRELPLGFAAATLARAHGERNRLGERFLNWWRPAIAVPAIAFLLLLAVALPTMLPRLHQQSTQISALYDLRDHAALMATEPFEGTSQAPIELANDSSNGAP